MIFVLMNSETFQMLRLAVSVLMNFLRLFHSCFPLKSISLPHWAGSVTGAGSSCSHSILLAQVSEASIFCRDEFHGSLAVAYLKVQLPSFAVVPFGKRRQTLCSSRYCWIPMHMISFDFSSKMGEVVLPTNSTSFSLGPNISRDKMILFPFKSEAMCHHP